MGIGGALANSGTIENLPPEVSWDPTQLLVENMSTKIADMPEWSAKQALQTLNEKAFTEDIIAVEKPVENKSIALTSLIGVLSVLLVGFSLYIHKSKKRNTSV